jgi:ankyrin repeat protein
VKYLSDHHINFKKPNDHGWTLLLMALAIGHEDIVNLLFSMGANFTDPDKLVGAPLRIATFRNNIDGVKHLLTRRVAIDKQDSFGFTALMNAAIAGNTDIVGMLLDNGAEIGRTDRTRRAALHHAASNEQKDTAILLVQRAARVNASDSRDCTALHFAAEDGRAVTAVSA